MILKLNDKYLKKFISEHEYECIAPMVTVADKMLREKSGLGNSFLGWIDLPQNYDKEEFKRIKDAAKRIQADCDAFIVIGIGVSHCQHYSDLFQRDSPDRRDRTVFVRRIKTHPQVFQKRADSVHDSVVISKIYFEGIVDIC